MNNAVLDPAANHAELLELGIALGQNHAFGLVAGRCSAAQADTLRRLREEKKYLQLHLVWKDFCPRFLNMSSSQADRIIALLEEFGPGYFELAQLTRISAETYRVVEPVVKAGAIHFRGEAIQLDPENARRVAAAVAEMRREATVKKSTGLAALHGHVADLHERFAAIIAEIEELVLVGGATWAEFGGMLHHVSGRLSRLLDENQG